MTLKMDEDGWFNDVYVHTTLHLIICGTLLPQTEASHNYTYFDSVGA